MSQRRHKLIRNAHKIDKEAIKLLESRSKMFYSLHTNEDTARGKACMESAEIARQTIRVAKRTWYRTPQPQRKAAGHILVAMARTVQI